jgi:hypothetical protein
MPVVVESDAEQDESYGDQNLWNKHERKPHFWLEYSLVSLSPILGNEVIGLATDNGPKDGSDGSGKEGEALCAAGEVIRRCSSVQWDCLCHNH